VAIPCAEHADREAVFRCEGCHRALCLDCVEEGHRLWFCRFCRERALPVAEQAATTPAAWRRERRLDRPESLAAALGYVFRGRNALTLPAYVLFLTLGALLPGPLALLPLAVVALVLPGFLLAIVHATAEGVEVVPDWPDFGEPGARAAEWLQCAGVALAAALPGLLFRRLADCDVESFLVADGTACTLANAGGAALAFAVALLGLGAVGAWGSGWLSFRLDLHLEALLSGTRGEAPVFLVFVAGVLAAALAAARALADVPLLGLAAFHAATGYALFTTAHLAGMMFRRHRVRLERIYLR
jgi:hypothetical protein